jgi:hypothetical protein
MKNQFIPVNSLKKAIAFAPTLDAKYRRNTQLIKTKDNYLETLDIVQELAKAGWEIEGVAESRSKNRVIESQHIKLFNPDISLMNGKTMEGKSNIILTNSTNGKKDAEIDFGVWRKVCSNGLVIRTSGFDSKIKHDNNAYANMRAVIAKVNEAAGLNIKRFENMKNTTLNSKQMKALAEEAIGLRWQDGSVDAGQLLNINRPEDRGTDLWSIFNRVQENLTKPRMLVNKNGHLVSGVEDVNYDLHINRELTALAESML